MKVPRQEKSEVAKAVDAYLWKRVVLGSVFFLLANIGVVTWLSGWMLGGIDDAVRTQARIIASERVIEELQPKIAEFSQVVDKAISETETRGSTADEILTSIIVKVVKLLDQLGELRYRGDQIEKQVGDLENSTKSALEKARNRIRAEIGTAIMAVAEESARLEVIKEQNDVLEKEGLTQTEVQAGIQKLKAFLVLIEKEGGLDRLIEMQRELDDLIPVGSIVAWHRDLEGVPKTLPDGWIPCDGRTIGSGTLKGLTVPNLNDQDKPSFIGNEGGGAFLRGETVSGTLQKATTVPIFSEFGSLDDVYVGRSKPGYPYSDYDSLINDNIAGRITLTSSNTTSGGTHPKALKVRPVNMSVVWIMRVK